MLCGVLLGLAGPATGVVHASGDLVAEVERLRDLTFTSGSGLYVGPTSGERAAFAKLTRTLLAGDLTSADSQAAALGYEVVSFEDTASGRTYHGLRELLVAGAPTRGWGSYFFDPAATIPVLVEVPHARFDTRSWEIGALVLREGAAGFLMNGAHRNANGQGSADVAHLAESIFQEVHDVATGDSGERATWQIHGFAIGNHPPFPVGTDAVLSNGDGGVSPEVIQLDAELDGQGYLSHAFNTLATSDPTNVLVNGPVAGTTFSGLGATTNVQGQLSRGRGATFVHVELEQSIRFDAAERAAAASTIAGVVLAPEPDASVSWALALFVLWLAASASRTTEADRPRPR